MVDAMTTAPANLNVLGAYYVARGGVNDGIVGDVRHTSGYHCGRDRIYGPHGKGAADYSVQTARDRAGLSNYASAIDIGVVDGSYAGLRAFSRWFVDQCRHNAPDTQDVREVIYSPDGTTVLRWDRERGVASEPREGEADNSHRTHTHISYYRDSRGRDQRGPFRRYFEPAPVDAHTLHIAHNATVVLMTLGPNDCIVRLPNGEYGEEVPWPGRASKAACSGPVIRPTCDGHSQARIVHVRSGAFKGKYVRVDPPGVTVT